jgi:hypothetical protein
MLSEEELKEKYIQIMLNRINDEKSYDKKEAKTIQQQIEECQAKLELMERLQSIMNYRDIFSSVVDEETISKEYEQKRNMMLQIYNEGSFSKKIASRMRYAEERGKGSIASFFASIFNGKNIDREIKIKQDERIRQEITNKYVESINIKVHELQKSPISKVMMDSFLLEMEVLVEKTENNTPIFESVRKQVDDTKKAIDSSKAKAEELINNIRISIAKVLYIAQLTDYISGDDVKD